MKLTPFFCYNKHQKLRTVVEQSTVESSFGVHVAEKVYTDREELCTRAHHDVTIFVCVYCVTRLFTETPSSLYSKTIVSPAKQKSKLFAFTWCFIQQTMLRFPTIQSFKSYSWCRPTENLGCFSTIQGFK